MSSWDEPHSLDWLDSPADAGGDVDDAVLLVPVVVVADSAPVAEAEPALLAAMLVKSFRSFPHSTTAVAAAAVG